MYELKNKCIKVELSASAPLLKRFTVGGDEYNVTNPYIIVYLRKGMDILDNVQISVDVNAHNTNVIYNVSCLYDQGTAVTFDVRFSLSNNTLFVDFDNVCEAEGFYLFGVKLGQLITVSGDGAKLAIPSGSGRLLDIQKVECRELAHQIDSKNALLFGCAYTPKIFCVLETDSYENRFFSSVFEQNGVRYGGLSIEFIYRLAEFELIEYGHLVPAVSPEYYLKTQDNCRATLTFGVDVDGDGVVTWQDGIHSVRALNQCPLNPFYKDKIIGKICADDGTGDNRVPFNEIGELIQKYAALTLNQPAVFYLVGWQFNGHDTGYPAIDQVNQNLGTLAELRELISMARQYNVTISFHDNYDDAYMNSPAWDPDVISRDASGEFMKCGFFVQGQAYLISNHKYVKYVPERVADTINRYGIRDSYHIDVLAGAYKAGRRYDFNPESPASAKKNLEGKLMVVEEFAKYGVDVTTEDFSSMFIGHVGHFWHLHCDGVFFQGEEHIPLVSFLYHSLASWGISDSSKRDVCLALLHGACFSKDLIPTNIDSCIDMYYLVSMPWMKLYGKVVKNYTKDGTLQRVTYQDGSVVEVDMEAETYSVTVDGQVIAKNFTTLMSREDGVYLAYSRFGGKVYLPASFKDARLNIEQLSFTGHEGQTNLEIDQQQLVFDAKAATPYKITINIK